MPRRAPRFQPASPYRKPARAESKRERDAFYTSARWMKLRLAFLRANPVCSPCLEAGKVTPATIAHHVVERLADPRLALDPSNLMPMCDSCHSTHHKTTRRRSDPS